MNNLSSYCWLVDAKIRASDKDLHVSSKFAVHTYQFQNGKKKELLDGSILYRLYEF